MIRINLLKQDQKKGPRTLERGKVSEHVPSVKEKKGLRTLEFNYNLIFLLVIILMAALFFTQSKALKTEKTLLDASKSEKAKLQNVVKTLTKLEQQRTLLEKKINLITQLKSRQGAAVWILAGLSQNLPDWVWLTEASFKGDTVTIKGKAVNNKLVAEYLSNLENDSIFADVELKNSTQKKSGNNLYYEFSLTSRYVNPKAPAGQKNQEKGKSG